MLSAPRVGTRELFVCRSCQAHVPRYVPGAAWLPSLPPAGRAMGAAQEAQACLAFYRGLGRREPLRGLCRALLAFLQKLQQFAGGSVKRCKDKNLEEALLLFQELSKGLWELDDADVLPLVRCVLAFQMETTSSSSSFHKLEQIVTKLSEGKESLVAEEVNKLMSSLTEYKQVLSPGELQTVCMFIEESSLGRHHWRLSLAPLLLRVAATLNWVLQDPMARSGEWSYITVKTCLQLFQAMPKEVSPLVWSEAENSEILQSILGSLLQVIMGQTANKDARLLASTAVSMLVNTAAEPERGARAVLTLFQLVDQGPGELRFGDLKVETSVLSSDGLARLVLTRGLLTCCKKEILSCRLDSFAPQACLLLDVLFPAVWAVSEEQKDYHYYRFQVFSLWLQRVLECLPEIRKVKESRMLAENSELLHKLSQFIWNNAESPVEGASEFIRSSFQHLLEIYRLECHHFEDLERPLYEQFLQRIITMPWQVKARYFPLCAILPYVGTEKVLDTYKDLPQHLLNCLSTNHLCPAASDVYKTILQQQRKQWIEGEEPATEEELAQKWALHWLPTLASALTSPISFLQSNASNYLLVWTLRLFPASYALLAESCSGGDSAHLRAWVALLNGRKIITGALPLDGETLERLCCCLHSREDNIRLAALGLLCCSPRTNQALSEVEVRLLKKFLPLNLNCDSSSFRQLLQAAVRKALVRLRDSALSQLRSKMQSKATERSAGADPEGALAQAVDFVEWLLQLSISFLTPGSNYQRKKTALLLLAAVLETCTDTWSPARKKGQPPQNMEALLSWARQKGCWDFFSRSNLLALLSCLQDSTNEVRELASELLIRYFPPAFPEPIAVALFERAQEAVSSPRVQEAEAGAVLMKTILQKSDGSTLERLFPEGKAAATLQHRGLCFAQYLLRMLQAHYAMACQDLLQAASTNPMHGVMVALRRCLLEVPEGAVSILKGEHVQNWQELLSHLVTLLGDISTFLLGVLQSRQGPNANQPAAAPSFADMVNAIGSLIMLGKGLEQQDGEDAILLSEEHNLILTCCWVSVKEIGLLLGGLVEKILPLAPPAGAEPLLPLTVVKMAARVFQEVLLKCRHWGAVEGCSMGFTKFCTALLNHPHAELQAVPRTMLAQGLELLSGPRSSSITRRAAGFPMLFLCILGGEDPSKARPLLAHCIQTLLALANTPLPQNWDQTLDLPQVSALHVLQTLVRGSGLGTALLQYVTPMMALLLKALGSSSWAMRNAAIQLFSALAARVLGPKRSRDDSCAQDGVSPQAFFSRYPQLREILLGELHSALETAGEPEGGRFHLCPSLHAILTLLAKLQPGADGLSSVSTCFLEPLLQLAGNPIYAVRVMAAKALVPVVPTAEYGKILLRLAGDLAKRDGVLSHNTLHGRLLQIQALLAYAADTNCSSPDAMRSVAHQMEGQFWLVTPAQQCPLIRSAYLQVISLLAGSCTQDFAKRFREVVSSELHSLGPEQKARSSELQVGSAVFHQVITHFLCKEAASLAGTERVGAVCLLLQGADVDIQSAILTWVIEGEEERSKDLEESLQLTLLENLKSVLQGRRDKEFLKLYLEALVHLCRNPPSQAQDVFHKLLGPAAACVDVLLSMVETESPGPDLLFQALSVISLLFVLGSKLRDYPLLERWCVMLERCSRSISSEVLRLAAARSLKLAGADLVQSALEASCPSLLSVAVRVMDMGIYLLQDEDQEVRREASVFASLVQHVSGAKPQDSCVFIQGNRGLVCLLHVLLEKFWGCQETFEFLLRHLPTLDLSNILTELEANKAVSLYKEDEPNVFAEPAVLSRLLLPFLLQLLDRVPASTRLCEFTQRWLKATGPSILHSLQHCKHWWSREAIAPLHMKALGCAKVHAAVTALLVKATLLVHVLDGLERTHISASEIHCTSQELRSELVLVQELLAQHGMAPTFSLDYGITDTRSSVRAV
ncbi:thyroid adenoma-associated protein homolog isoform X1 [Gopherus flavomarginatus]|uniref:thyroid adenoma-associated protein homolog isoform X1 n=2 Tax=Gopherus flavomarginatus TaxID=286002 RepID=UPI0021CC107D|nr:thyroid adenoma-associated protein homolog isoform X1 [Gopherus flavomarginatus]